ncbi:MAG: Ig-like domain-containing protein [Methanomassiliicoccales archaeon]|nr:MAG: Ig-like domain-containing protein [Methanomassiliicoccales archaeon]
MTKKWVKTMLILGALLCSFVVISVNTEACFSWFVFCDDTTNNVDKGDYTIYEIEASFSPGCRSEYWVSFWSSGEPAGWTTVILDESGLVIPFNTEFYYQGSFTILFSMKVTAPATASGGEKAYITMHIRANDKYNQNEVKEVLTTTTVNGADQAPNPVILSEDGNTTSSINLTWTESDEPLASFDRYEVYMSLDPDFTPVQGTLIATISDRGTTDYTVTGLSPESTYYFIIRVWDNDPQPGGPYFADSNLLEGHTCGFNFPPTAVILNEPQDVTNQGTNLCWSENEDDDFARYEVHVSKTPSFTPSAETLFGDPITDQLQLESLTNGLNENTTYYFKIRVYDTGGLHSDSNEESCTTLDFVPEQIILDDPFDTSDSSTKLSWSRSEISDFDHYEVHMSQTPDFILGPGTKLKDISNISENFTTVLGLEEKTKYYFKVRVFDNAGQFSDSNEVWETTLDSTLPRIILTSPYNNEIGVGLTKAIVVNFNEEMDINSVTFVCFPNPEGWFESWSNNNQTLTFTHNVFESKTTYQFHITSGKDLAGNVLIGGEVPNPWSFETEDIIPPVITLTNPINGALNVPTDAVVAITFSEAMDKSSVTFSCSPDPEGWEGSWSNQDKTITFTHNSFESLTTYTCQITAGKDVAGNDLISGDIDNPWSFDTEDATPPTVLSTTPSGNAQNVPITTSISITFSEEMDHLSVENALVTSFSYDTPTWDGNTITLTPTSDLEYSSQYTITIDTEAMDLAENHLSQSFSFQFTTEAEIIHPTNHAPVVGVSSPNGDTAHDVFTIIWTATDQDEDQLTINIYFDLDDNPDNGMTLIEEDVGNTWSYIWDTSNLDKGNYYVYITAFDGTNEVGSYSGLLTIDHTDDTTDTGGEGDEGTDDDHPDGQVDTNIGDTQNDDTFPWILLWIILCIILVLILIMAMAYRSRKDKDQPRVKCGNCDHQFTPFDPNTSTTQCPNCGESTIIK